MSDVRVSRDATVGERVEQGWHEHGVQLSTQEKGRLRQMIRAGRSSARAITRARILLKTDQGWTASQVAAALDISERTVFRAKRRYAEEGLDEVLRHRNQVSRYRKLDDRGEAHLIALACSPARRATTTGRCACWRAKRWSWDWPRPCPTRRCGCG